MSNKSSFTNLAVDNNKKSVVNREWLLSFIYISGTCATWPFGKIADANKGAVAQHVCKKRLIKK